MPDFNYEGVNKAGQKVNGKISAPSEGDMRMALRAQGIRPVKVAKIGGLNTDLGALISGSSSGRVSLTLLVPFTRQLQVLIGSGIPLVQSLEALGEQAADKNFRSIILAMKERVSSGSYLWEAMSNYPKAFPKLFIALVRAGEASGSIDQMLKRLSRYLEDSDRMRKILKSAMMYPIVVTCVAIGVIWAMLVFVIPKFEELLRSSNQELPGPTKFVIDVSHFLVKNFMPVVGGTALVVYLLVRYVRSPEGKAVVDRVAFKAPLFGNIAQKAAAARFARTMQTLLTSGVNLIDAIDICRATVDNAVIEEAVSRIRAEVESGKSLATVVARLNVFPTMAVQMISVGESTGNLDKMLEKVADFYEEEVEVMIQGLTKLIEPIMLVILGGAVGGLMVAMYLPIFKLAGAAG